MADLSYGERVRGPRPAVVEEITREVWGGFVALVSGTLGANLYAQDFPLPCADGGAVAGTDEDAFWLALTAEIPELPQPAMQVSLVPDTLAVLDLVELLHRHASEPEQGKYHPYFGHHHLKFDPMHGRHHGRQAVRERVNRLFRRNGLVYELTRDHGVVRRSPQPAIEAKTRARLPATTDESLDELLEDARQKFLDPDPDVRREGLFAAWDAFERIKTVLDQNKKRGIRLLVDGVTDSDEEAELIDEEMQALTRIGNSFRIRHHETGVAELSDEIVEPLFGRMYALLHLLHGAIPPAD